MQDIPASLATILDHVGDGVTVQDASGQLVYANAAAARSLRFATAEDLLAAPLAEVATRFDLTGEDGTPFAWNLLPGRRVLAGEDEATATIRFHDVSTGEARWSTIRASPIKDSSGEVVLAVNVWQDVTARQRGEAGQRFLAEAGEALAASLDVEATLQNIARLAVPRLADWCAIHLVGADGGATQLAVAHVDPERVAWALALQERYPPQDDPEQGVVKVVRTGRYEFIPEITDAMLVAGARDAEHLAILRRVGLTSAIVVPMIVRERVLGAISFIAAESRYRFDETDRELAEELARRAAMAVENARLFAAERAARQSAEESRARFQGLFEWVPDAILVVDVAGSYVAANEAAGRMLGYQVDELLALDRDALTPHSADSARFPSFPHSGEWRGESELVRRDGSLVPVEIWSRRLDLLTGPIGISVVRDISERIAADQIREEVLSAIAHDLRNPLGAIKLQAQGLLRTLRRGTPLPPERLEQGLAAIDAMSSRVASLLDDVVAIARDGGQQGIPFAPEPTDLVSVTRCCVEEVRTASGRDLRLESSVAALVGQWDPRGLERVILNLLTNAVKYSPEGGPVQARVETVAEQAEAHAVLVVEDQGIGIPAADLPRVFDRYRRGHNVGQIAGTGLGLTGAHQIVARHGGTIEITSRERDGTRVTVRLPLEPRPEQANTDAAVIAATSCPGGAAR